MSGIPPAPRGWRRVSRQTPCPACGKPDWCGISVDGGAVCCMRVQSDRQLGNGGWLHRGADQHSPVVAQIPPTGPALGLAPVDQRDHVYRAFVRELGLLPRHTEHLLHARGLPTSMLECFASAPPRDPFRLRNLAGGVIDRLGSEDVLRGVPGFLVDRDGRWACRGASPGFLVPVPDAEGRIQAFQLRFDRCSPGSPRYIWYSSSGKPGGCSTGTPAAYWRPSRAFTDWVIVTEGSLKAAIVSWHLCADVIGVPGVANWARVPNLVPRNAGAVVAFDADAVTNPHVARHQRELARALFWTGHHVTIASWSLRSKGIDDALLAGERITLTDWPGAAIVTDELGGPAEVARGEVSR